MEFTSNVLSGSNQLLNSILDNINSAIFIVNKDVKIVNFNNAFKTLFYKEDDDILDKYCGNALGCVFVYREKVDCGGTSHCDKCQLRKNVLQSFVDQVPVYKQKMIRDFVIDSVVITKYLEFTTKNIFFENEKYTLVIIDDITDHELQKQEIVSITEQISAAKMELEQAYKKLQDEEAKLLKLEQQNSVMAMIVTANHELNQPLAVLKGNIGLMKAFLNKNSDSDSKMLKYVQKSEKAINDTSDILKKYRDSAADFDFGNYTDEIKMVSFHTSSSIVDVSGHDKK